MENLITGIQAMSAVEWIATITALFYVGLAAKESVWCWFFGIISCTIWAYITFTSYNLYLDAGLNVFYVLMGFWGIYQWQYGSSQKAELPISRMTQSQHARILVVGAVLGLLFGYFFDTYTPAAATYLDAFTTVFAIIATFLVVQKKLENWWYWVVIDAVYVYLYITRGAYLFAVVYLVYTVIAVFGYFSWKKNSKVTIYSSL